MSDRPSPIAGGGPHADAERCALEALDAVIADALDSAAHAAADRARVATAIERLEAVLVRHVGSTEAPGGLLAQVRSDQPRLDHAAARLEAEHADLQARVAGLHDALRRGATIELVASQARATRGAFDRHRDRGTRLALEAWNRDLGGDD